MLAVASRAVVVAYLVGARPNWVKVAPVLAAMKRRLAEVRHLLIDTGQHYHPLLAEGVLDDGPVADVCLGVGSGSHATQTAKVLERIEPVLERYRPRLLVVPGDVNSSLAGALAAVKVGVPVAHLEAGLRSFDRSMPEEVNRVLIDAVSDILFTTCEDAAANLVGCTGRVCFVGNTMIDTLAQTTPTPDVCQRFGLRRGGFVLLTLHRPAMVDGPLLQQTVDVLGACGRRVLFPAHPRVQLERVPPSVTVTAPLPYREFLSVERDAYCVVTDSGGVQEETTWLGVPCLTLRDNTERPVTITEGTNRLVGLNPSRLPAMLATVGAQPPGRRPLLWDGRAAERVADALLYIR